MDEWVNGSKSEKLIFFAFLFDILPSVTEGIDVKHDLTLKNITLDVKSLITSVRVDGTLTIDNASLLVNPSGTLPSIICNNLVLKDVEITSGHTYDATTHKFLDAAGNEAKDDIIIGVDASDLKVIGGQAERLKCRKVLRNGQLVIDRNGQHYSAMGERIR